MSKSVTTLTVIMIIVLLISFGVLVYNMMTYSTPTYRIQSLDSNQTLVMTDDYLGKVNTISVLQVFAILILAVSVTYAGLLNYLKQEKINQENMKHEQEDHIRPKRQGRLIPKVSQSENLFDQVLK